MSWMSWLVAPQWRYCACSGASNALRIAATKPGTVTPFSPVAWAKPLGSICTSIAARCRNWPDISGITPAAPWALANAPKTQHHRPHLGAVGKQRRHLIIAEEAAVKRTVKRAQAHAGSPKCPISRRKPVRTLA